jgi:putative addiction module component (TIGR02574 family)
MPVSPQDLLSEALELSPSERALLAARLIDSLDPTVDSENDAAWEAEIARRLTEIDSGRVTLISWDAVRARMQATCAYPTGVQSVNASNH